MASLSNTFYHILTRLISLGFAGIFGMYSLTGIAPEAPVTPGDFTPVVRFAVCSDVHLDGDPTQEAAKRLGYLFDDTYAYAKKSGSYKKLDAVIVAGDFATTGDPMEYKLFNRIVKQHKKDGTQILTVLGNHEFIKYRDEDASVAYDVYKKYVYPEVDRHDVINGYHFIGVSYDDDGKYFTHKLAWLSDQLDAAVKDDPDKPIFVYQHPHPFGTVYGSVNWSDAGIRAVLELYPQVVDFSGHSHYASSDPRSIWQAAFTAVGTGSLKAYMSNLNYVSGDEDAPGESGGFWIVEADKDGNVRLQLYDAANRVFFENVDYYLSDLSDPENRPYSWDMNMNRDTAPLFPDGAEISAGYDKWDVVVTFPNAAGYFEAENYKIAVSDGGIKPVWEGTVVSNYVRAVKGDMSAALGELEEGTYTVSVTANSPYEKEGQTITGTVTLTAPAYTPGDVDLDGAVTPEDARLALRASVGLEELDSDVSRFRGADMDHNSRVSSADARTILRMTVNLAA